MTVPIALTIAGSDSSGGAGIQADQIGMVAQPATIRAIAATLSRRKPDHVVRDPVMVATSGDRLLSADALTRLRDDLIPLATLISPYLLDAAALQEEAVASSEAV